jgi:hypothetical protein
MMTHLSDLDLLAIAEGNDDNGGNGGNDGSDAVHAHLDACGRCREKLASLRDALNLAAAVVVPEPSPLFWDHFSARVRSSLQDVEPGSQLGTDFGSGTGWRTWLFGSPFKIATATAIALLAVIAGLTLRMIAPDSPTERADTILGTAGPAPVESSTSLIGDPNDDAWALVRDAADDVTWDDAVASGWMVPTGSADEAAMTLTTEERGALVELLREETKRSGA